MSRAEPGEEPAVRWVDSDAELEHVVDALCDEPVYALDTEFVAERTYWPRLCLVQLASSSGVALVDSLACDVAALRPLLDSPGTMVTHAGGADLPILERACAARPRVLYDTQVAAGFLGLGTPSLRTLVSGVLGARLDKSEQLTDWGRRPLGDATRRYAAGDVAHLLALMLELTARLTERDRLAWSADECEVLRTTPLREQDPDTAWWRVKGARTLRGEAARIAQAVAAWRERRGRELDRPPRFVLSELVLAGIVARPPRTVDELTKMRGGGSLPQGIARAVLGAVDTGRTMDRAALRLPPRLDDDPALDAAAGLLTAWAGQVAAAEDIEPRLLATRDDVKALVNGRPSRLDNGWRAALVGERLRELVDGEAVLRLVDRGRRLRLEPDRGSIDHGRDDE